MRQKFAMLVLIKEKFEEDLPVSTRNVRLRNRWKSCEWCLMWAVVPHIHIDEQTNLSC